MRLTADQELRREFLLFSLSRQPDLEAAIAMASRMEQFVLGEVENKDETRGQVPSVGNCERVPMAGKAQSRSDMAAPAPIPSLKFI
jgi:hypothetical protein